MSTQLYLSSGCRGGRQVELGVERLAPNSAAAERVFSFLKSMFGDAQMSALADMIQAALMLKSQVQPAQGGLRAERVDKQLTRKVSSEQTREMAGL